ncbi:MAG: HepT-like ribonuclease domain-containing protein [Promethearchaeota archaeon]
MSSNQQKIRIVLEDILEFCSKIKRYTKDLDKTSFEKKEVVIDAVLRNLELLGEASKKLPEDFKNKYDEIPWKKIIGLRNIVIHEYSNVDLKIV